MDIFDDFIEDKRKIENIECDKMFINELLEGLDKDEMRTVKEMAFKLMKKQCIHKTVIKLLYNNAYKYIAVRRLYKKEIQIYTGKSILGDYISVDSNRWVTLP